jgi:hypothetical protein
LNVDSLASWPAADLKQEIQRATGTASGVLERNLGTLQALVWDAWQREQEKLSGMLHGLRLVAPRSGQCT